MDMKRKMLRLIIITLVIISAFFALAEISGARSGQGEGGLLADWIQDVMLEPYFPSVRMMRGGPADIITNDMYEGWILAEYPVLLYGAGQAQEDTAEESDYARLMMMEGRDEERKAISEDGLEYDESAMHLEQGLADALLAENGTYIETQKEQEDSGAEQAGESEAQFQPSRQKSYSYDWSALQSYEMLIKAFYAVDSTTRAGEDLINLDALLSADMRMRGSADEPQILIYHTHSQEAFADSEAGDSSTSIVGVGERLAAILREEYGYNVLHHTASYDAESRDYAYSNALPAIEELLAEYPSVEVVIDLHRDAVPEDRRLVVDLQGRPTAQFMFFNGLSRTAKGEIEYLENPYLADNLAFSFQMQAVCNEYYPGLARRIYLKAYRYNMHVCPRTLLIELGAQNNTVEEAMNACDPLAHVLDLVLSGGEPER